MLHPTEILHATTNEWLIFIKAMFLTCIKHNDPSGISEQVFSQRLNPELSAKQH